MHVLSKFFTCFLHDSDHFCGVFLCFWTTSNWSFGMIPMGYMVIKRPWILGHPGGCGSGLSSMSISSCRFSAWRKSTTPAIFGRCHGATCVGKNISTRRSQFHVAIHIMHCYAQDLQQPRICTYRLFQHAYEWDWSLCHLLNNPPFQCTSLLARLLF